MLSWLRSRRDLADQVQWLTERFYQREREIESRYEQRIKLLEDRLTLAERILEFLKVAEVRTVPSPLRTVTDWPESETEAEFQDVAAGNEDGDDGSIDINDVVGDMFPPHEIEFDENGLLLENAENSENSDA